MFLFCFLILSMKRFVTLLGKSYIKSTTIIIITIIIIIITCLCSVVKKQRLVVCCMLKPILNLC